VLRTHPAGTLNGSQDEIHIGMGGGKSDIIRQRLQNPPAALHHLGCAVCETGEESIDLKKILAPLLTADFIYFAKGIHRQHPLGIKIILPVLGKRIGVVGVAFQVFRFKGYNVVLGAFALLLA
jgi:hypothetical protein